MLINPRWALKFCRGVAKEVISAIRVNKHGVDRVPPEGGGPGTRATKSHRSGDRPRERKKRGAPVFSTGRGRSGAKAAARERGRSTVVRKGRGGRGFGARGGRCAAGVSVFVLHFTKGEYPGPANWTPHRQQHKKWNVRGTDRLVRFNSRTGSRGWAQGEKRK